MTWLSDETGRAVAWIDDDPQVEETIAHLARTAHNIYAFGYELEDYLEELLDQNPQTVALIGDREQIVTDQLRDEFYWRFVPRPEF